MKKFLVLLCVLVLVFSLVPVASALNIDFETFTPAQDGSDITVVNPNFGGLDWTRPDAPGHWRIEDSSAAPFAGSGGSANWLQGFADDVNASGTGDFAKITQLGGHYFTFSSMDLRGRSAKPQWLTSVTIRARDTANNEVFATVGLTDVWTTYTAAALGFDTLGLLKSITFFGTSSWTTGNVNDRFALDNLNVTAVPEPGTLLLLGSGLAGLGILGRRRKKLHDN